MRAVSLFLLLFVAACGAELPPADGAISAEALTRAPPELIPLDPLLAQMAVPSRAAAAQAALTRRGAGLARRDIAVPVGADLEARGARLRARADALRAAEV